eukprot:CFRG2626T1
MSHQSPKSPKITEEFLAALPKTDLHLHLDGSVRLETLIDLAQKEGVELPAYTVEGLQTLVFKEHYEDLFEYLAGFGLVGKVLQSAENLERVAYELGEDCFRENCRYIEVRFAPQLHFNETLDILQVVRAVNNGLRRAKDEANKADGVASGSEPEFDYGVICTAMRMFSPQFSDYYRDLSRCHKFAPDKTLQTMASQELARAAVYLRDVEKLPIVGFDLAGSEDGYPAKIHEEAFQYVTKHFMNRTVHAGEAFGPESIFQAIIGCNAQRIGHGYHLFNEDYVTATDVVPKKFVEDLVQYVAEQRICMEVCLTSNLNTMPLLRELPLSEHAFGNMLNEDLSITLSTDNRSISRTNMTKELGLAVEHFKLGPSSLRELIMNGFKSSFHPSRNAKFKKTYVEKIMKYYDSIEYKYGFYGTASVHEAMSQMMLKARELEKSERA